MEKVDSQSWKEVRLIDLFDMQNTHSIAQRDLEFDSGTTPYVTAQSGNNGVLSYVSCPDEWKNKGPCIMIGGKTTTVSFQNNDFCSNDSHNIVLYIKDDRGKGFYCQLFLVTVLKVYLTSRYSWDDSVSMKRLKKESITLPMTEDGDLDWNFMKNKMSAAFLNESPFAKKITSILYYDNTNKKLKNKLNIHKWQKFHLYDDLLFTIDMGTKLDRIKMSYQNPEVNFVGRANINNGITARVDRIKGVIPYEAGNLTLSLGGEYLGSCFIQPDFFYTSQNVVVLIPKWNMPFEVKLFISCVIFRESRQYYKAFVDELNRHVKTDFSFYLPVKSDNTPDWDYMIQYMNKIINDVKDSADELFRLS